MTAAVATRNMRVRIVFVARDLMNSDVMSIPPETTVGQAIDILIEHGISGLPVVDADRHVLGIITEFALLAIAYDPNVVNDPVAQHMTKNAIAVETNDPLTRVADLFIVNRIRRVLVLQGGKLAGLISRRDLLKAVRNSGKAMCSISPFSARNQNAASLPSTAAAV